MEHVDLIIIGSGVAGLSAALAAAGSARTLLLTKATLDESNTRYAQGGIAAAIGPDDSAELHLSDTLAAGNGLVDRPAAAALTAQARAAIDTLVRLGVPFDRDDGRIALGREAAHSARRIIHAGGDATGAYLERTLTERVRDSGVEVREQTFATRLLVECGRVTGVETLDCATGAIAIIEARAVILATGGAGRLYSHTTNPAVATADGIALAYEAGAEVMDMEFIQFHPTAFRLPGAPSFLISEAVRGEGAILRDAEGRAFMADYDPRKELAPRDVVARAIHAEMARSGADCVFLDLSHLPAERVHARFPQIDAFCRSYGLDLALDPIPVAPAAHYTMGGVRTTPWGETNVAGLFACGEAACTGVHGANRLASNSLLEGLVFGRRTVERALSGGAAPAAEPNALTLPEAEAGETDTPSTERLQRLMWENAGIVRSAEGLSRARAALSAWDASPPAPLQQSRRGEKGTVCSLSPAGEGQGEGETQAGIDAREAHELANLILAGRLVAEAAWRRTESRGAHFRSDYPETSPRWQRHQVFRKG
jgi:L-aspartate oxidase